MSHQEKSVTKKKTSFNLSPYHKRLIAVLGINIMVIIGLWVFVDGQSHQINKTSQSIIIFREKQSDVNNLLEYIARLERELKEIGTDFDDYQNLLVDKRDLAEVRQQINSIFLRYKLDPMFNFVTENSPRGKEPSSYSFNLILTGSFNNIFSAIKEVRDLNILITFDQVIIEKVLPRSVVLPDLEDVGREGTRTTVPNTVIPKSDNYKVTVPGKIYLKGSIIEN